MELTVVSSLISRIVRTAVQAVLTVVGVVWTAVGQVVLTVVSPCSADSSRTLVVLTVQNSADRVGQVD